LLRLDHVLSAHKWDCQVVSASRPAVTVAQVTAYDDDWVMAGDRSARRVQGIGNARQETNTGGARARRAKASVSGVGAERPHRVQVVERVPKDPQ
jgi:hypothetical protein